MWLLVVGGVVLVIVVALIGEAMGYKVISKPSSSMQEYNESEANWQTAGFRAIAYP